MIRPFARAALMALLPLAVLASDAAAQDRERERRKRPIPGRARADPGAVVAADIAFARSARDDGQWTAFREYAGSGAQMHGDDGTFDAVSWLAARADPAQPVRWAPSEVWSSCDGSLAVSYGRSTRADGTIGGYVTVWQRERRARGGGRERGSEYRWIYTASTPDNPQPPPPPVEIAPNGDTIVVTEILSINARAADCGVAGGMVQAALSAAPANIQTGGGTARDGTLNWRWEQHAPGVSRVVVDWVRDGAWAEALAFDVPDR